MHQIQIQIGPFIWSMLALQVPLSRRLVFFRAMLLIRDQCKAPKDMLSDRLWFLLAFSFGRL
jgi:hypothetical protein